MFPEPIALRARVTISPGHPGHLPFTTRVVSGTREKVGFFAVAGTSVKVVGLA